MFVQALQLRKIAQQFLLALPITPFKNNGAVIRKHFTLDGVAHQAS